MPIYVCSTDGHSVEVRAISPEEAAETCVSAGDWGPRSQTSWIHIYVEESLADGKFEGWGPVRVELEPDVPPCVAKGRRHRFRGTGTRGSGGGTISTSECRWCGVQRSYNTWGQDPYDGSQGHNVESYSEERDPSFVVRPFVKYPDIFAWGDAKIEVGDVVKIYNNVHAYTPAVFRMEPSDEPWGWTLMRLWDHEENSELCLLPQENRYVGLPLAALVEFWEDDPNTWRVGYLGRDINNEDEKTEEVANGS